MRIGVVIDRKIYICSKIYDSSGSTFDETADSSAEILLGIMLRIHRINYLADSNQFTSRDIPCFLDNMFPSSMQSRRTAGWPNKLVRNYWPSCLCARCRCLVISATNQTLLCSNELIICSFYQGNRNPYHRRPVNCLLYKSFYEDKGAVRLAN